METALVGEPEKVYFEEQLYAGTDAYHLALTCEIRGSLDRQAFRQACRMAFEMCVLFRARVDRKSLCWQWAAEPQDAFDRCYREIDARQEQLDSLHEDWLSTRFCLEEGRLCDWRLIRLSRDKHIFYILQHHIVMDGSSFPILSGYISTYYNSLVRGETAEHTLAQALSLSEECYRAEDEALERTRGESAVFWQQKLADISWRVTLPSEVHHEDREDLGAESLSFVLDKKETDALRAYAKEQGTTLFVALGAVYGWILCKHSNCQQVTLSYPVNTRPRDFKGILGCFVNTIRWLWTKGVIAHLETW